MIYLDYAATSPVKPEVFKEMEPFLKGKFGNPSSIHSFGREARAAVDEARGKVANFFGSKPEEVIFTSGGTEADNLAVRGVIAACSGYTAGGRGPVWNARPTRPEASGPRLPKRPTGRGTTLAPQDINFQGMPHTAIAHIITTAIEHHAVLNTCKALEKEGLVEVTYLKPNNEGLINPEQVQKAIKPNTVLVSIIYVNNEIGTVQPIREIGKLIEKENKSRSKSLNPYSLIYFHSDAVQAAGYFNCNVDYLHVDLLSIAGHKIGAPKGIGALYVRKGTKINPIIFGGEQEWNLRAGTENVAGIVGLGIALQHIVYGKSHIAELKKYLIDGILKKIPKVELNGSQGQSSPGIANFYFPGVEGESIVMALDLEGIACSTGSACASVSLEPSHVISACYDVERAHSSIRFSLGEQTTKEEIDYVLKILPDIIKRLRSISTIKT